VSRWTYKASKSNRQLLLKLIDRAVEGGLWVTFKQDKRTLDQNALMWKLLTTVSQQAEWHGKKRSPGDWKDLFTASLLAAANGLEAVPGLEGGFMILGLHTSDMTKAEESALIEWIYAWGANHGVTFDEDQAVAA
jgi:hypothetical protein